MDVNALRHDFPILSREINGRPLIYLDNAATTQKPISVISAISDYYTNHNANVHRGVHTLSDESTQAYEASRLTVANFIGATDPNEVIFTRNTTESINLVAFSWALNNLQADDEILVTELEHHSNLVSWQRVCQLTGAKLIHLPVNGESQIDLTYLKDLVGKRTKLVAITQISNVTGTIIDIQHLARDIRQSGSKAKILVDGAQAVPHMPTHVNDLNIHFLAFSGHKMCGPMGIGCLWVKREILETMDPFLVGGGMINHVSKLKSTWADLPDRFDAGTPNVAGAVGLAAACHYLKNIGLLEIQQHEQSLTKYGIQLFEELESRGVVTFYGPRDLQHRSGILTFNVNGVHAHDVAQILDREAGIAIRSGHHCNQVILEKLGTQATCRASFYLYNNSEEIDSLIHGIEIVRKVFNL